MIAPSVTQFQESRVTGGAVRYVIPLAMLVRLILSLYGVRIRSEVANCRFNRATLPLRIRIALKYRALNLALQTTVLFFGRFVHRSRTLSQHKALQMASNPPEESTEPAVNGIRVPPETLTDFIPIITSLEHPVYLKVVLPSQFLEFRFEPTKIEVRPVRALGIASIADQGVIPSAVTPNPANGGHLKTGQ